MEISNPVRDAVYAAIEDLNGMLPPERRVSRDLDAPLSEPAGPLNSLGLVNLVVAVEDHVEQAFGVAVNLADGPAASAGNPFATVRSLATHLQDKLGPIEES